MIPAEVILKHSNAANILAILSEGLTIIPGVVQAIHPVNQSKLLFYNKNSLNSDLNDDNLKKEIEKLELTKDKSLDLSNLKNEYMKFSKESFSHNRFQSVNPTIIPGVGVDGAGYHPLSIRQENIAINKIEDEASIPSKWNPSPGDGEDILKESVKNVCFWQASNVGQLPIGSPVQVCSAVIELLSPINYKNTTSNHVEFLEVFTGKEFIKNREEIEGLRYFIDGNMFDIENKNTLIKGIRDFENQNFKRFGRNGIDQGAGKEVKIYLVNKLDSSKKPDNPVLFQNDATSVPKTEIKMIGKDVRENLLSKVISDKLSKVKEEQRGVILFLFTIFFEYACYIFNLYEEKLIKKLKKTTSKEIIEQLKRANYSMISSFILLINYSLIKKFEIKDPTTGEYYDAKDFITVDQASNPNSDIITDKSSFSKVVRRICSDEIKLGTSNDGKTSENFIRIYFKNNNAYNANNWSVDENEFTFDKFPIVFDTNLGVEKGVHGTASTETFIDVNYRMTIERLTKFLLQNNNGVIPKTNDGKIIAVGAPFQNDEIFEQTFEALDAYYDYVKGSKQIYKIYAQLKLDIYRSGYPSSNIVKWYNLFLSKFDIIFRSSSNPLKQQIELLKVIATIMNEYKKYREQELKYMDDRSLFDNNSSKTSSEKMYDVSREKLRGILSTRAGLSAEMIVRIAELSYQIYAARNPVTSNFIDELKQKKQVFDAEIAIKTQKILDRLKIQVNRKFGKGSAQSSQLTSQLVGINYFPPTPPQFLAIFGATFPQLGISAQGGPPGPQGSPAAIGKVPLLLEQRLKVENIKFWQDLRTIFSGRTIFLPVAKLNSKKLFDDNEFYLIDILRTMIFNKLYSYQISTNGKISQQLVDSIILNNGSILLSTNTVDLGNPNSWRCINYINIAKFKRSGDVFKDIKKMRGIFFNLIANNGFLTESMNVSIPAGSNTSGGLVKYCTNILKKDLPKCNILISRQQFAQTVQPKMASLSGTSGIDLMSGVAYFEHGPYIQARNSNIVVR